MVRTPPPQAHHAHIEDRGVLRSQARERTRRRAQLMEQINNAADGAGPLNQPPSVYDPGGDPGEALNGGEDQNHLVQPREQNGSGIGAAEAPQIDLLIALEHLPQIKDRAISEQQNVSDAMLAGWPTPPLVNFCPKQAMGVILALIALFTPTESQAQLEQAFSDWPIVILTRLLYTLSVRYSREELRTADSQQGKLWRAINHAVNARSVVRDLLSKSREIWVLPFCTPLLEELGMDKILHEAEIVEAFPKAILDTARYPVLCWKYADNAGKSVCNEARVIREYQNYLDPGCCQRHRYPARFKNSSGHVVTTDLQIVDNKDLREYMDKGTTFRTDYTPSDGGMVTELVGEALQKYIIDTCSVNEVPGVWFEEWIRLIMARLKDRLTEMNSDNSFTPDRSSGRQYKGAIKALQQDFAICTADKASSTYVLVCKHHLASQVEVELDNNDTYTTATLEGADDDTCPLCGLAFEDPASIQPCGHWFCRNAFRDGNSIQKHQGKDRQNVQCAGEHLSPYRR